MHGISSLSVSRTVAFPSSNVSSFLMNSDRTSIGHTTANKTDAGNGSNGIYRVIDASHSPSPDQNL
jgi:hypothetical protein